MDDWSVKVMLACDADYRNQLLDKRNRTGSVKANHELQVYHIMLRISVAEIQEIYHMKGG
ncbi:MAG TPA: hypothetical protein IAA29_11415 [Candidatus Paenibacillus intestinavium]|nr:hypothetical protein [Candidatus Paenibacillus intestinavium]